MIVLGVILILVGYLLPVPGIIATIGWILLVIGLVLLVLGRWAAQSAAAATGIDAQRHWLHAVLGELIHTTAGTWITRPPSRCPNGTVATIPADR